MLLTEKQQKFVDLIAVQRKSYTAAYSEAYGCEGLTPAAIARRASTLASKPQIAAEINVILDRARAKSIKAASYTLDDALREAEEARELAMQKGQASAAAAAVKLKAQIAGHVLDRKEVSEADPLKGATLDQLAAMRDEITRRMQAAKDAQPAPQPLPVALAA